MPTAGSGSVTGGTQTTSAGIATVGSWTINAGTEHAQRNGERIRPQLHRVAGGVHRRLARCRRPTSARPGYSYFLTTDAGERTGGLADHELPERLVHRWRAVRHARPTAPSAPYNLPPIVTQWGIGDPSYVLVRKDFYVPAGTTTVHHPGRWWTTTCRCS